MRIARGSMLRLACTIAAMVAVIDSGWAETKQPFDHAGLARMALERHIRPGYARLADSAARLATRVEADCGSTAPANRKSLESAFDGFVSAWGRIEHIRFGPIATDNRLERILFWPDRRGIGARQISRVLQQRDEGVLDAAAIAGRSVALQGMTALEYILFPADIWLAADQTERDFRCKFALSVASNLAAIAKAISSEWAKPDGFALHWLKPGAGNPHFVLPSETTLAVAKAFDEGIERVRDERIRGPLGLNAERRRTPVLLARSGRTMLLMTANIEGLLDLLAAGGLSDAIRATNFTDPNIDVSANLKLIADELEKSRSLAQQISGATKSFDDQVTRSQLIAMGFPLKNARLQTGALLTLTADIAFGFNSSDGD